jgi:hypothetical protein
MLKKLKYSFLCLGIIFFLIYDQSLLADSYAEEVYANIEDIYHPTLSDYQKIQDYLSYGHRPLIDRLNPWQYHNKALSIRFIGRNSNENIESGIINVNCKKEEKENCIVLYSSFNFEYPKAIKNLINTIKNSDFKGHIIYRIGGWPDLEGGSLIFSHIPFAFKICAFKEAERLGYKNALWLDASVMPLKSLNKVFDIINKQGYFTFLSDFNIKELCNREVCEVLGVNFDEAANIPGYIAGILGFNFKNKQGLAAVNRWFEVTKYHEECYFSYYQEFCVISIILHQMGLKNNLHWKGRVTWERSEKNNDNMEFLIDKYTVQPNWPN